MRVNDIIKWLIAFILFLFAFYFAFCVFGVLFTLIR